MRQVGSSPPALRARSLTTGPPGKSPSGQPFAFFFSNFLSALSFSLLFPLSLSFSYTLIAFLFPPFLNVSFTFHSLSFISLVLSSSLPPSPLLSCSPRIFQPLSLSPLTPLCISLSPFLLLYFPPSFSPHSPLLPCASLPYPSILFHV